MGSILAGFFKIVNHGWQNSLIVEILCDGWESHTLLPHLENPPHHARCVFIHYQAGMVFRIPQESIRSGAGDLLPVPCFGRHDRPYTVTEIFEVIIIHGVEERDNVILTVFCVHVF